jgi:hypothetical protein
MEHYNGLTSLKVELQTAAVDKGLSQERKVLALELLEFMETASAPEYKFEHDEYFPDIDSTVLREIKISVAVRNKWAVPIEFGKAAHPQSSQPVPTVEPDLFEEF